MDMTPMIDCVFQLIIFFMLSSTFVVQSSIQIQVPKAKGAAALEQKDLSITLAYGPGGPDEKGSIYVNNTEVRSLGELSEVLAAAHTDRPDARVLIRTDARVEAGRFVEVLGIVHSVGFERSGVAAQPLQEDE